MRDFLGTTGGILMFAGAILLSVGDLYWLWLSFKIGSFLMFAAAFVPPFGILTPFIGAWALVFGTPQWVTSLFG